MHPSWAGAKHPFLVNLGALPAGIGLRFTFLGMNRSTPWSSCSPVRVGCYRAGCFVPVVLLSGWGRAGVWVWDAGGRRGAVQPPIDCRDKDTFLVCTVINCDLINLFLTTALSTNESFPDVLRNKSYPPPWKAKPIASGITRRRVEPVQRG